MCSRVDVVVCLCSYVYIFYICMYVYLCIYMCVCIKPPKTDQEKTPLYKMRVFLAFGKKSIDELSI